MTREEELEYFKLKGKERYIKNPTYFHEKSYRWLKDNPESAKEIKKRYRIKVKTEALNHYGGLICAICKETEFSLLSIDHINGGGNNHRREIGIGARSGTDFYAWLRKNKYPNDPPLRVLCLKCNKSKKY